MRAHLWEPGRVFKPRWICSRCTVGGGDLWDANGNRREAHASIPYEVGFPFDRDRIDDCDYTSELYAVRIVMGS